MIKANNLASRLAALIAERGKSASFADDVIVQDDGDGARLVYWHEEKLGPAPTQEQVNDVDDLFAARNAKWAEIKQARDAARDGGFPFGGKLVQSDPISRDNVAGAALAAMIAVSLNAPYKVEWTMADNSTMDLDGDKVIAMFRAGAQHVQDVYARGVTLREEIAAVTTEQEIQAIAW